MGRADQRTKKLNICRPNTSKQGRKTDATLVEERDSARKSTLRRFSVQEYLPRCIERVRRRNKLLAVACSTCAWRHGFCFKTRFAISKVCPVRAFRFGLSRPFTQLNATRDLFGAPCTTDRTQLPTRYSINLINLRSPQTRSCTPTVHQSTGSQRMEASATDCHTSLYSRCRL